MHPERLNELLIDALCQVNQDFKSPIEVIKNNKDSRLPMPTTLVREYGLSDMDEQGPHHKNKYVYAKRRV